MAKVKVTSHFEIASLIEKFSDPAFQRELGEKIVDEAKDAISEGQSPVKGHGRFAGYKDRNKYPGDQKPHRPVNLELSGEMLRYFTHRRKAKDTIEVGILAAPVDVRDRARAHNEGTSNMAMRRFIPQTNEEWSVRIMRKIRDLYGKRLEKLIKQSNKK